MSIFNFKRTALTRQAAIGACTLAMLLAGNTASAHWRWYRPRISGSAPSADVAGTAYSFTPTASGPSGYNLTFAISGQPSWASFNPATGQLAGTPTTANVGTFSSIVISVSDGMAMASLAPFSITISPSATPPPPTQTPPTISGTAPTTAIVGTAYSFTPSASDSDGDPLSFSVQNLPAWATFSSAAGTVSGTPVAASVGTDSNIVISVSDGTTSASLAPFSVTVAPSATPPPPTQTPPTISGTAPTTAIVGTAYGFTPSASDSDGDPLSFSVQNLPAWATFSIATGTVSGTPVAASVGTDSNIVISVSDGTTRASLAPFSINVAQPVTATTGTATLTWTAPTTNTDGSALTDLAGYYVYYGTSPSAMSTVVNISSAGATTYTVSSLASGTWYFAVAAYTTSGLDSALSSTLSKAIP